MQKAKIRKAKQNLRKKLGGMEISRQTGWKKPRGPLPPTRSVFFVDNTAGGELARRLQEAEVELVIATGYRERIVESSGSPFGMLLPSTNP